MLIGTYFTLLSVLSITPIKMSQIGLSRKSTWLFRSSGLRMALLIGYLSTTFLSEDYEGEQQKLYGQSLEMIRGLT